LIHHNVGYELVAYIMFRNKCSMVSINFQQHIFIIQKVDIICNSWETNPMEWLILKIETDQWARKVVKGMKEAKDNIGQGGFW
jgi:hypothetical protein